MTVLVYRSTDDSAPNLTQTAGSLISVLDFCLLTTAGWTKEFSGTNLATYRPPSGNRFYLAIDDTTTTYARIRSFEEATAEGVAESSGSGPMPTDTLLSGGGYVQKGASLAWHCYVSDRSMYLFTSVSWYAHAIFWGDLAEPIPGDSYHTALIAAVESMQPTVSPFARVSTSPSVMSGHWVHRSYSQLSGSVAGGKFIAEFVGGSYLGAAGDSYPSRVENALKMSRVPFGEVVASPSAVIMRGILPGLWDPLHLAPLTPLDTFSGSGDLSAFSFCVHGLGTSNAYQCFVETSDTWY